MEHVRRYKERFRIGSVRGCEKFGFLLGMALLSVFFSGCMLINPVKRMDLEEISFKKPLPNIEQRILVLFEEVVPGKPLNETVWDNFNGPYWDQDESKQIGLTVSYRVDPVIMPFGTTAVTTAQGARWVVPFGPLISYTMKSAMEQHSLKSIICYTDTCAQKAILSGEVTSLLRIKPTFKVWTPSPTSLTLNYSSDLSFGVYSSPSLQVLRSGQSSLSKLNIQLNSIISYKAISQMREYSKEYAEEVVSDVLTKAYGVK